MLGNDINLRVGFDVAKLQAELAKTNSMLSGWGAKTQSILMGAFGFGGAAMLLQQGIRSAVSSLAQFQHAMQEVRAITQATDAEFKQLRDNALGLAGAFKAVDIARMEVELGRLGFSTKEIIDTTEAAVNMAISTGSDLARSADVIGSTLRAFNLNAEESGRVADIMASGFNKSALSLENFAEAIKYVAPVAQSAGLSLEQTTAMLGVLADADIRGSMAGTSLRKIISDLGQGAAPVLNQRLREMAIAGMSGADAMDEVGRTAYASLLILANNTAKVEAMTKAHEASNGELEKTKKIMEDDLIGDWNKFNAEIDRTVQKGSAMNEFGRAVVQVLTNTIKLMNATPLRDKEGMLDNALENQGLYRDLATGRIMDDHLERIVRMAKEAGVEIRKVWDDTGTHVVSVFKYVADQTTNGPNPFVPPPPIAPPGIDGKEKESPVGLIQSINNEIKRLSELRELAFGPNAQTQIAGYNKQLESLKQTLEALNNMGVEKKKKDTTRLFDLPGINIPSAKEMADSLGRSPLDIGEEIDRAYKGMIDLEMSARQVAAGIRNALIGAFSGIGKAIATAIEGGNVEAVLLATIGSIATQLGELLIGIGVGMLALKESIKDPIAAIAAGVALVALGSLASSKAQSITSSAGSGGGGSSVRMDRPSDNINMSGELVIRGADLVYVLNKQGYRSSTVGG